MPIIKAPHRQFVEGNPLDGGQQFVIKKQLGIEKVDNLSDEDKVKPDATIGNAIYTAIENSGSGKLTKALRINTPAGSTKSGITFESGTPLEDIVRDILTERLDPTVKTYSSLTFKHNQGTWYEVGTHVPATLTFTYEPGVINTWNPTTSDDDTVALSGPPLKYSWYAPNNTKLGEKIATEGNTAAYTLTIGYGANTYTGTVEIDSSNLPIYYDSEATPTNVLDAYRKSAILKIPITPAITGGYYRYTVSTDSVPTSGDPKDIIGVTALKDSNDTFTFIAKAGKTKHVIALREGRIVKGAVDADALFAAVSYVKVGTLQHALPDGGGLVTYNLYVLSMGTGYTEDHEHNITLAHEIM